MNDNDIKTLLQVRAFLDLVFIGTHLNDGSGIHLRGGVRQGCLSRHRIKDSVNSGTFLEQDIEVKIDDAGTFRISIDLVSEQICWFEDLGSEPLQVDIDVLAK